MTTTRLPVRDIDLWVVRAAYAAEPRAGRERRATRRTEGARGSRALRGCRLWWSESDVARSRDRHPECLEVGRNVDDPRLEHVAGRNTHRFARRCDLQSDRRDRARVLVVGHPKHLAGSLEERPRRLTRVGCLLEEELD